MGTAGDKKRNARYLREPRLGGFARVGADPVFFWDDNLELSLFFFFG